MSDYGGTTQNLKRPDQMSAPIEMRTDTPGSVEQYHMVFPSKHARIPTAMFLNPIDAKNYKDARCRDGAYIEAFTLIIRK